MAKSITVIPATRNIHTGTPTNTRIKRRVAGYARVSTDSDEQFTSYEAQIDYYTKFIQSNPDWEFVNVYTDEGISGVMTKNREGFNKMIDDALAGKIDLIVTKSVSRFARNTVDSLSSVRRLKEKGVEVFFQKENIYTLDAKGELLIELFRELHIAGWRRTYPLVGKPDFVFPKKRIAVFVDGCFWHGHDCRNVTPSDNAEFWAEKREYNKKHDTQVTEALQEKNWTVIRIWECQLKKKNRQNLIDQIQLLLDNQDT